MQALERFRSKLAGARSLDANQPSPLPKSLPSSAFRTAMMSPFGRKLVTTSPSERGLHKPPPHASLLGSSPLRYREPIPHDRLMHRHPLLSLLIAPLLLNCGGSTEVQATNLGVDRQIRDLISALSPSPPTANSAVKSDWIDRRREIESKLATAGPEVGQAALDRFLESDEPILDIRRGLLRVAVQNLPEETAPLLEALFEEYGEDLGLRTSAIELLAESSPADAIRLVEPILAARRPGKTYPPAERLVACYAKAAKNAGLTDLAAVTLADYASNLFLDQAGRVVAVKALSNYPGPHTRATLRTVLVESTGDAYLRRMAADALVKQSKVDPETAASLCDILNDVMNKEADVNFQLFLVNMIAKYCP